MNSRIVATTHKFVIMPMVGPLVPGYLLIVPKDHYLSISQLPKEQIEELKIVKEELKKVFENTMENQYFMNMELYLVQLKEVPARIMHIYILLLLI